MIRRKSIRIFCIVCVGVACITAWMIPHLTRSPLPDHLNPESARVGLAQLAEEAAAKSAFGLISDEPLEVTPTLLDHTSPEAKFAREYFLQLGVTRPIRDADANTIFAILDRMESSSMGARASMVLFECLSAGHPYELLKSEVTPEVRMQCISRVLDVLTDPNHHRHDLYVLQAAGSRVWRYPEIRQAIESLRDHVYQDRAVMHHFQYMLAEMDAVPPDAIDPDPYLIEFERKQMAKPKGD